MSLGILNIYFSFKQRPNFIFLRNHIFYIIFSLSPIQSFIIRLIISGRVGKSSSSFRRSSIFFMISL